MTERGALQTHAELAEVLPRVVDGCPELHPSPELLRGHAVAVVHDGHATDGIVRAEESDQHALRSGVDRVVDQIGKGLGKLVADTSEGVANATGMRLDPVLSDDLEFLPTLKNRHLITSDPPPSAVLTGRR